MGGRLTFKIWMLLGMGYGEVDKTWLLQVVQLIRQVVRELAGYMDQLVTQANISN